MAGFGGGGYIRHRVFGEFRRRNYEPASFAVLINGAILTLRRSALMWPPTAEGTAKPSTSKRSVDDIDLRCELQGSINR